MRRCLALLAVFGILSSPVGVRAENPFDFPSAPPSGSTRRTAQVFSKDAASTADQSAADVDELRTQFRRSTPGAAKPPVLKNFSSELFGPRSSGPATETASGPTSEFRDRGGDLSEPLPPAPLPQQQATAGSPEDSVQRFERLLHTSQSPTAPRENASAPTSAPVASSLRDVLVSKDVVEAQRLTDAQTLEDAQPVLELGFSTSTHRLMEPIPTQAAASAPKPQLQESAATGGNSNLTAWGDEASPLDAEETSSVVRDRSTSPSDESSTLMTASAEFVADDDRSADEAPSLSTEWKMLTPLNVGQDCDCELIVRNTGGSTAKHVALEAELPPTVHIGFVDPQPESEQGTLAWRIETLAPGESQTIRMILVPHEAGSVVALASVRYTATSQESFTVSRPMLQIAVAGPDKVNVGEPAPQTVTVTNPGSGVAANVKLEAAIPEGLEHSRGKRLLMDIGSLNPGESRTVRLALAAVTGGEHILQVAARADSNLVKTASAEVHVVAPSLTTTIDGPSLRYLGREATYRLSVRNDGNVSSDNVRLMHKVPEGFEFIRADRGAQFDDSSRVLSWFVGRLEAAEVLELNVTLNPSQIGEFNHLVRAISEHGTRSDVQLTTRVAGVATLAMDVTDVDDPVEVGGETAYEIRITNDGTAPAHQIGLVCELPEGTSFRKAAGPADHRASGNLVTFASLPELKAGESLMYRVHVVSTAPGDVRFRCRLTSESVGEPLTTEELTRFYGE